MRKLALGLCVAWLLCAFLIRLSDMRRPGARITAMTGAERGHVATLAWIEGQPLVSGPGRLIVADMRVDGKLLFHHSAALPIDYADCRLWLEEAADLVQAVARCPGRSPLRLSASGEVRAGLGPDERPATLYQLYPLLSIAVEDIVNRIHRRDRSPVHPVLFALGLLCTVPLWVAARRTRRKAERLGGPAVLSGVMEEAGPGLLTIRDGDRRVTVYVERGEVISVGLGPGAVAQDDGMLAEGLRASVQGAVEQGPGGAFRGRETLRLLPGSVIVVGDAVAEAQRRLSRAALVDVALALSGAAVAAVAALGLLL